ncbi:MAG: ADP-ribosyltransferase domain-containing protein [Neisseria sp.]|nr:ADP-ribosyltransferase domain-containing protein [Neisseria sp.]
MQKEVEGRLKNADNLNRRETAALLAEIDKLVDAYYWQMAETVQTVQPQIADDESEWLTAWFLTAALLMPSENGRSGFPRSKNGKHTALSREQTVSAAKRAAQRLTVGGLTVAEAMAAQAQSLKTKLKQAVRTAAFEPFSDGLVSDVADAFKRKAQDLAAFSQTWIGSLANQLHFAAGKANPWVKGWRHLSVLDGKTSSVCLNRHGKMWRKNGEPLGHDLPFKLPPVHINCRSRLVYVFDTDAPFDGISGEDWVKRRSLSQLQEQFGKGVGQMLYDGEISLSDAVKSGGLQTMTLQELQRKYPKGWAAAKQRQPMTKQALNAKLAETAQAAVVRKWMNEDLYRRTAGELENPRIKKLVKEYGLTQPEAVALRHYTETGYKDLNAYLRGLMPSENFDEAAAVLNEALGKLPDYRGVVVRRDNLPVAELAKHKLGEVVEYPSFTSATFGNKDVLISDDAPHRLKIHSKYAKRIDWISKYPKENEVLFAAPTRFIVKDNPSWEEETGLVHIILKEE